MRSKRGGHTVEKEKEEEVNVSGRSGVMKRRGRKGSARKRKRNEVVEEVQEVG